MTPQRWQKVKSVFQTALEHSPHERASFLAEACTGDTALREEVESLLTSHGEAENFIEKPAFEVVSQLLPDDQGHVEANHAESSLGHAEMSELIPDYELIRVCGQGAFGIVWIVKDRAGAYRAMKVIELGKLARWGVPHREMKALEHYCRNVPAHPNLAQIFHIGQNEHMLYYTMELADDLITRKPVRKTLPDKYQPMTFYDVLSKGRLNTDTAVEVTLRLLNGLSCLHESGLAHRDIKPANILFVERQVKLADVTLVSIARSHMSMAGTPKYMPPDEKMDATADTYAVGKVLYEMITGRNLASFPHLPQDDQISSSKLDLEKLDAFLVRACASSAMDRFPSGQEMQKALLDCRYPLHDSPLLELAREEIMQGSDDSDSALAQLQKAAHDVSYEITPSGTFSKSSLQRPPRGDQAVWAVIDRIIRLVPWLVLLILGLTLINRLL